MSNAVIATAITQVKPFPFEYAAMASGFHQRVFMPRGRLHRGRPCSHGAYTRHRRILYGWIASRCEPLQSVYPGNDGMEPRHRREGVRATDLVMLPGIKQRINMYG